MTIHVTDSLIAEHRVAESLLMELEALISTISAQVSLEEAQYPSLQTLLQNIHSEMNTHFACEEQALFPAASRYHPMVLMEVEHEELIALRDKLELYFPQLQSDPGARTGFCEVGERFIEELRNHIAREEAGIFPTCERCLSDTEKRDVIQKMEAIRAEAMEVATPTITRSPRYFKVFQMHPGTPQDKPVTVHQLEQDNACKIKQLVIRAGESMSAFWSPNTIILFCISGEALFEADQQKQLLKPGMGIFITPQLKHALHAKSLSQFLVLHLPSSPTAC